MHWKRCYIMTLNIRQYSRLNNEYDKAAKIYEEMSNLDERDSENNYM